jgi:RNA polymerase-binding transcription factor DksA
MRRHATCDYASAMSSFPSEQSPTTAPIDLDAIEQDLADVETALARLDADTYWSDEVTGAPIADAVLEANPLARRNPA